MLCFDSVWPGNLLSKHYDTCIFSGMYIAVTGHVHCHCLARLCGNSSQMLLRSFDMSAINKCEHIGHCLVACIIKVA